MIKSVLAVLMTTKRNSGEFPKYDGTVKEQEKAAPNQRREIQRIAAQMSDRHPGARMLALRKVADRKIALNRKDQAFELLASGLEDPDAQVRSTAVKVLGKVIVQVYDIASESRDCGPCGLESPDPDVRVAAARATGRVVCPIDVKAAEMLAQRLTDSDEKVREAATEIMRDLGFRAYAKAMQIISRGSEDADAAVRRDAVNLISIFATRSNLKHLDIIARGSRDKDQAVQFAAAKAKAKVESRGTETDVELFTQHMMEHSDAGLRRIVMLTMREVGTIAIAENDPWGRYFAPSGPSGKKLNAGRGVACRGGA